jgi:Fe-S cluster assembly iron-binding protein IscA
MIDTQDIALTPSAAARVAAIAERQGKPAILRLSVEAARWISSSRWAARPFR